MKNIKRSELSLIAETFLGMAVSIILLTQALNYFIEKIVNEYYDYLLQERYANWIPCIYFFSMILFIFSMSRATLLYDKALRESYWKNQPTPTFKCNFLFALSQKGLWIIIGALVVVYLVLPLNWTFKALSDIFSGRKFVALAIYLPVLTVLYLLAYISACKHWSKKRDVNQYSEEEALKLSLLIGIVYAAVPILLVYFLPVLTSIGKVLLELVTVELVVAVFVLIVCLILAIILRAYNKRKKCIKELKKVCDENKYVLSEIHAPYSSVFKLCEGENFRVIVKDKVYSCKFIGVRNKYIPLIIHENGALEFVYSTRILNLHTRKTYCYESEHKKILIVNPTPKFVYTFRDGKTVGIDNGENIGDYKFYTASAFLRALEFNALDK